MDGEKSDSRKETEMRKSEGLVVPLPLILKKKASITTGSAEQLASADVSDTADNEQGNAPHGVQRRPCMTGSTTDPSVGSTKTAMHDGINNGPVGRELEDKCR